MVVYQRIKEIGVLLAVELLDRVVDTVAGLEHVLQELAIHILFASPAGVITHIVSIAGGLERGAWHPIGIIATQQIKKRSKRRRSALRSTPVDRRWRRILGADPLSPRAS